MGCGSREIRQRLSTCLSFDQSLVAPKYLLYFRGYFTIFIVRKRGGIIRI